MRRQPAAETIRRVRARAARFLASRLTEDSGVHVIVRYHPHVGRYAVEWTGGPTGNVMRDLADRHATDVPTLDVTDLAWLRTEPPAQSW